MFGTSIKPKDLFSSETLIATKNANAILLLADTSLNKAGGVGANQTTRLRRSEAIGGQLHLTNYRLIFKSHPINFMRGKFSIFLNTIQQVNDASQGILKQIEVNTKGQDYQFVIWGIPDFLQKLNDARQNVSTGQILELKGEIENNPEKVGSGLGYSKGADLVLRSILNIETLALNPLSLSSYANMMEIFGEVKKKEE